MAKLELGKKKKRIMLERLQTQLDLALRNPSSRVDEDPFKDDLKIVFEDVTVAEWLLKIVNQTGATIGPDGIPIETFDEVKKESTTKGSPDIMGEPYRFLRSPFLMFRKTEITSLWLKQVGTLSTSTTLSSSLCLWYSLVNQSPTTR